MFSLSMASGCGLKQRSPCPPDRRRSGRRSLDDEPHLEPPRRQRWFHLNEDGPAGAEQPPATRFLFEIRTKDDNWWLDAFVTGPGYKYTLIFPEKVFPVGHWYAVAQTYDGKMYRSYVNGQLQGEAEIAFTPQGPGKASVGSRMNKVDFFKGAIREARFSRYARQPSEMLKA
jgi:hypothetical protein